MANFLTDTFTATGGTGSPPVIQLNNYTGGETGHTWNCSTDPGIRTDTDIVGSRVGANSYEYVTASATPPSADYSVSLDITVLTTDNFTATGASARVSGASRNSGYFATIDPNEQQLILERHDAGSRETLGTPFDISGSLASLPATFVDVEVKCEGDQISALINGVTRVGPVTDATYSAAGLSGFYLRAGTAFGDITVDNISGDTLAAGGASLSAADNVTSEGETATFTLSGNTAAPTSATLNGTDVGTITDVGAGVYSYTAPLIADDATADLVVSVDATTVSTVISYANSYIYDQITHGVPDANSINSGNQYATALPYEWKVVTDANAGVVTIDWAAMAAADGLNDDIDTYATTVADGITTVTIGVFIPESGATETFDRVITVTDGSPALDNWPFSLGIRPAASQNWEWGNRHPLTGMRVRVYK